MSGFSIHIHIPNRKNSKFRYYLINAIRYTTPNILSRFRLRIILSSFRKLDKSEQDYILMRVNHYNKMSASNHYLSIGSDGSEMIPLRCIKLKAKIAGRISKSVYIFDSYTYTRFFNKDLKAGFLFGDITYIPLVPSFVKSRPIAGDNANSVILPLNKVRHHTIVRDRRKFSDKMDMLVGRAFVAQPHRIKFWEMYYGHPMCDLGNINHKLEGHKEWNVASLSIEEHLKYKFILCLEGNDVASNLKWVMSSNSLAVMPRPKYETWFLEGSLIPDFHYVEIKQDFSDLEEKLKYYINHPEEAEKITQNANEFISQFQDRRRERLISLMVVKKYFASTEQIT